MAILEEKITPYEIKLEVGDKRAQGMYILLKPSEEKYTAKGVSIAPTRNYKIEVAVETIYNNKRYKGKKSLLYYKRNIYYKSSRKYDC